MSFRTNFLQSAVSTALPLVLGVASTTSCGGDDDGTPTQAALEGGATDAPRGDSDAGTADGADGASAEAAADAQLGAEAGETQAEAGPPQAFLRIADWAPDAPAVGFDICLAPQGTMTWMGPILATSLPAGAVGNGTANGVQFPWVTQYVPVAPGQYDVQVVTAGTQDCTMGQIPTTVGVPALTASSRTTFALIGDVTARGNNAALKLAVFPDDTSAASGQVLLRVINASPGIGAIDVGTGDLANSTFSPLLTSIEFGTASGLVPDGGTTDPNGYQAIAPISSVEFSAHPTGAATDSAVTTKISAGAGAIDTLALVNGSSGGQPAQFLFCTDNAQTAAALAQCSIVTP